MFRLLIIICLAIASGEASNSTLRSYKYTVQPTWSGFVQNLREVRSELLNNLNDSNFDSQAFLKEKAPDFESSARLFDKLKKVAKANWYVYGAVQKIVPFPERYLLRLAVVNNRDAQEALVMHLSQGTLYFKNLSEKDRFSRLQEWALAKGWESAQNTFASVIYQGELGQNALPSTYRFNKLLDLGNKGWNEARACVVKALKTGELDQNKKSPAIRQKIIEQLAQSGWEQAQCSLVQNLLSGNELFDVKIKQLRLWSQNKWTEAQWALSDFLATQAPNNGLSPQSCFDELFAYSQNGWKAAQEEVAKALYYGTLDQHLMPAIQRMQLLVEQASLGSRKADIYIGCALLLDKISITNLSDDLRMSCPPKTGPMNKRQFFS